MLSIAGILGAIEQATGTAPKELLVSAVPIEGGLEAERVWRLDAEFRGERGRTWTLPLVAKELVGASRREAQAYTAVLANNPEHCFPKLFHVEQQANRTVLYLEFVEGKSAVPFQPIASTRAVVERLARFHAGGARAHSQPFNSVHDLDREADLQRCAQDTVHRLGPCLDQLGLGGLRPRVPAVAALVDELPAIRRELLDLSELEPAVLHGDLHLGNVLFRRSPPEPVLVDWSFMHGGSPLEDLFRWVQSVGYVRRDTVRQRDAMLRAYLAARGLESRLSSTIYGAYWLAGACTALGGALMYDLGRAARLHGSARSAALLAAMSEIDAITHAKAFWA